MVVWTGVSIVVLNVVFSIFFFLSNLEKMKTCVKYLPLLCLIFLYLRSLLSSSFFSLSSSFFLFPPSSFFLLSFPLLLLSSFFFLSSRTDDNTLVFTLHVQCKAKQGRKPGRIDPDYNDLVREKYFYIIQLGICLIFLHFLFWKPISFDT